jgi:hypothetical protein
MRALTLSLLVAAALLALTTGCGGSEPGRAGRHDNQASTDRAIPHHPRPLTRRQLAARLLTLRDLPAGYVKSPDDTGGDDSTEDLDETVRFLAALRVELLGQAGELRSTRPSTARRSTPDKW